MDTKFSTQEILHLLDIADSYAIEYSQCNKTAVGCMILPIPSASDRRVIGVNRTYLVSCKKVGCLRMEKFGDNSKSHRNSADCRAIHSEIDALTTAAKIGYPTDGRCMVVTRYPCEACAKAIINAGIKYVYFGGEFPISKETAELFSTAGVEITHVSDWRSKQTIVDTDN